MSHAQHLLREYQRQEGQQGGGEAEACASAVHRDRGGARKGGCGGKEGESSGDEGNEGDEGESGGSEAGSGLVAWAGEEYEEERVRGMEGSYLKYAARLRRQPLQCVRCVVHISLPDGDETGRLDEQDISRA